MTRRKIGSKVFGLSIGLVAALLSVGTPARADDASDREAIQNLMKGTFERPDAPLAVDPISVEADYAVAGWTQDNMGGRALLQRKHGTWTLILCSGESLKSAAALNQIGLPKEVADQLAVEIAASETDPKRIAMFDSFEGTMTMDAEGNHPEAEHSHGDK